MNQYTNNPECEKCQYINTVGSVAKNSLAHFCSVLQQYLEEFKPFKCKTYKPLIAETKYTKMGDGKICL